MREGTQARDGLLERVCERGRREREGVIVLTQQYSISNYFDKDDDSSNYKLQQKNMNIIDFDYYFNE